AGRRHQHRHEPRAAGAPRRDPRQHRQVRLLDVREPGPVERPARLLAVVAERDRDEAERAHALALGRARTASYQRLRLGSVAASILMLEILPKSIAHSAVMSATVK